MHEQELDLTDAEHGEHVVVTLDALRAALVECEGASEQRFVTVLRRCDVSREEQW